MDSGLNTYSCVGTAVPSEDQRVISHSRQPWTINLPCHEEDRALRNEEERNWLFMSKTFT